MYTIAVIRPQGHNIGNHAIFFATKILLEKAFGRLVNIIEFPATSKHESTKKAGLTKSTIHEINRFADGVIVGGGNLYENDEIDVDINSLASLEVPLFLNSISRGRIYSRKLNLSERTDVIPDTKLIALLNASSISLSRDQATVNHTHKLGLKDELGYCPTINMDSARSSLPALPGGENVGALISIRNPSLMNIPVNLQYNVHSQISYIIEALRKRGFKRVRLLCNDSRDLDYAFGYRSSHNIDSFYTNDVYQYLGLLRDAEMVVSYRLHATLPSLAFGTPCVSLSYDERASSLFDSLQITDQYINIVENPMSVIEQYLNDKIADPNSCKLTETQRLNWADIGSYQLSKFVEFKNLVEKYVHG